MAQLPCIDLSWPFTNPHQLGVAPCTPTTAFLADQLCLCFFSSYAPGAFARLSLETLREFDQQELTNTSWAFAEIRFRHMPLIEARLRPVGMKKKTDVRTLKDDEVKKEELRDINFLTLFSGVRSCLNRVNVDILWYYQRKFRWETSELRSFTTTTAVATSHHITPPISPHLTSHHNITTSPHHIPPRLSTSHHIASQHHHITTPPHHHHCTVTFLGRHSIWWGQDRQQDRARVLRRRGGHRAGRKVLQCFSVAEPSLHGCMNATQLTWRTIPRLEVGFSPGSGSDRGSGSSGCRCVFFKAPMFCITCVVLLACVSFWIGHAPYSFNKGKDYPTAESSCAAPATSCAFKRTWVDQWSLEGRQQYIKRRRVYWESNPTMSKPTRCRCRQSRFCWVCSGLVRSAGSMEILFMEEHPAPTFVGFGRLGLQLQQLQWLQLHGDSFHGRESFGSILASDTDSKRWCSWCLLGRHIYIL